MTRWPVRLSICHILALTLALTSPGAHGAGGMNFGTLTPGSTQYPNGGLVLYDSITFPGGVNAEGAAAFDAANNYGYFIARYANPPRLIKLALPADGRPRQVASMVIPRNKTDEEPCSLALDETRQYAYLGIGNYLDPGRILKIALGDGDSTPRVAATMNFLEKRPTPAMLDTTAGIGYFGSYLFGGPQGLVKVRLENGDTTPTILGRTDLGSNDQNYPGACNAAAGYAYFYSQGGIAKVKLGSATQAPSRLGVLSTPGMELDGCAAIDPTRGFAYFANNTTLAKIALGTGDALPTLAGTFAIPGITNPNKFTQALLDPARNEAYLFHNDLKLRKFKLGGAGIPMSADGILDLKPLYYLAARGVLDRANGVAYLSCYTKLAKVGLTQKLAIQGSKITVSQSCVAERVSFYSHNASGHIRLALYQGGSSRTLLWQSGSVANTASGAWLSIPISDGTPSALTLAAGDYWLAWQTDSTLDVGSCTNATPLTGFSYHQGYGPFAPVISATDAAYHDQSIAWSAYLTGSALPTPPSVAVQPADQSARVGDTVRLTCQANGTEPLAYQWYKGEAALTVDSRIRGATSSTLTLAPVQLDDEALYHCLISNALGTTETRQAFLDVSRVPPAIAAQPAAQTVAPGQPASFTVGATGTPPLNYQWMRDGVALSDDASLNGAQTPTLRIDFASRPLAGTYTCEVSNDAGKAATTGALLTVKAITVPTLREPLSAHPKTDGDFGHALASLGDVNGDGVGDIAVSAREDAGSVSNAGHVYIISGKTSSILYDLTSPAPGTNYFYGTSLAALSDLTGDGVRELAIGEIGTGKVYAVNVKTSQVIWTVKEPNNLTSFPSTGFSKLAATVPDLNHDGKDDLVIGAPNGIWRSGQGNAYLCNGADGTPLGWLVGPNGSSSGISIAGVPDTDGDGAGDIVIGVGSAKVFLFSGASRLLLQTPVLPKIETSSPWSPPIVVSGLPDIDGDGRGDIAVASNWMDTPGRVVLYSGASGAQIRTLSSDFLISYHHFGGAMAPVPDLDGDGVGDIAIGSPWESPGTQPTYCGALYLFSGKTGARLQKLLSPDRLYLGGFGSTLTGLPDMNGDGRGDLAVAAIQENAPGTPAKSGRVRILCDPELGASASEIDFGLQGYPVAGNPASSIALTNTGLGLLRIGPAALVGPGAASFRLAAPATTSTLPLGTSMNITVSFQPDSPGVKTAAVRLQSNDPSDPVVDLPLIGRTTQGGAPLIVSSPASRTLNEGDIVVLTVLARAYPPAPLTYQWFKDSQPLTDGGRIRGATSDTLALGPATLYDAGSYTCQVSIPGGQSAVSVPAQLQLISPVRITIDPVPGAIQAAIDAATEHSTITLHPGIYHERINLKGKNLALRSTLPTSAAVVEATIINGDQLGNVVTFKGTEDATCLLDGLTITQGKGIRGAGIRGNGTHATLRRCRVVANINYDPVYSLDNTMGGGLSDCDGLIEANFIADNEAYRGAGLAWCDGLIIRNTITRNNASYGGGLYYCNGSIQGNLISGNFAFSAGGGLNACSGPIAENTITSNSAEATLTKGEGGGLYFCGDTIHNTISNNRAYSGGGIHGSTNYGLVSRNRILNNSAVRGGGIAYACDVTNCLIAGNHAEDYGGGAIKMAYLFANNTVHGNTAGTRAGGVEDGAQWGPAENCIIYGNAAPSAPQTNIPPVRLLYCCVQDLAGGTSGTFAADPRFVNPAALDFRLQSGSPCIDAGHATSRPGADLDGDPRPIPIITELRGDGSHIDIGADEYAGAPQVSPGTDRTQTAPLNSLFRLYPPLANYAGFRFQWQVLKSGKFVNIPGATQAALVFTSLTTADQGTYRCLLLNDQGSAPSAAIILTTVAGHSAARDWLLFR